MKPLALEHFALSLLWLAAGLIISSGVFCMEYLGRSSRSHVHQSQAAATSNEFQSGLRITRLGDAVAVMAAADGEVSVQTQATRDHTI